MKDVILGKDPFGDDVTANMVLGLLADFVCESKKNQKAEDKEFLDMALEDWKWPGSVIEDPAGEEGKIIEWYETYIY